MSHNANAARGSATGLSFIFIVLALYLQRKWSVVFFREVRLVQSITTDIGWPLDKSIIVDSRFLIDIDCIDQSIEIDSNNCPTKIDNFDKNR